MCQTSNDVVCASRFDENKKSNWFRARYNKYTINPINLSIPVINKINNIIWNNINKEFPITNLQFFSINAKNNVSNIVPSKFEVNFNIRYR